MDNDYQLALLLQKEFNDESSDVIEDTTWKSKNSHQSNEKASSLVDPQWEFIDPTPDIHVLFFQFNERFFWNKLHGVEVKWSPRMTSCAGVCVYQGRSGFCSVRLSLPLLKLRPRKDLVETLLHEMIHAFLFVTKNNRDRDGHGPEFHKHMNRINQEAGTHISVYHSFHDEVRLYQQHWWRCNGPCQKRPPFFGMVRRSMNRAPGPSDNWWAQHEATCGGKFIKVKEPENTKKKTSDIKPKSADKNINGKADIRSFFPGSGLPSKQGSMFGKASLPSSCASGSKNHQPSSVAPKSRNNPVLSNDAPGNDIFKKPVMSHVHGFGSEMPSSFRPVSNPAVNNVFGFRDIHGQSNNKPEVSKNPSGKGHVLGGTSKPPHNGRGPFSGMLANKGSGTLVVSGKSTKARDNQDSLEKPKESLQQPASANVFSGTGHVLGKATSNISNQDHPLLRKIDNTLNKKESGSKDNDLMVRGESSKRASPSKLSEPESKRKLTDSLSTNNGKISSYVQPSKVTCPVCNENVLESIINSHLDECINVSSKVEQKSVVNNSSEVIVLSDSEEENEPDCKTPCSHVDCPGCSMRILESELNSHLSLCVSNSFDEDDIVDITPPGGSSANCPICGQKFPSADIDKHLENCASCSLQDISGVFDEDFSDEEEDAAVGSPSKRVSESGERLYPCPCCLILIESSKMNEHLDHCVV